VKAKDKLIVMDRIAVGVTLLALFALGMMRRVHFAAPFDVAFIPGLNAIINSTVFLFLLIGRVYIAMGEKDKHRVFMSMALLLSMLFFFFYLVYHFTSPETPYCKEDWTRNIYFILLISHILLAAIALPFILMAFNRAVTGHIAAHKRMVRWVFPLWLYVSFTGPLVYWMLKPCY